MITLRDYQQEMIARVHKEWESHRSVMVQMPTGTGKTHVLASIVASFSGKILIVAHRRELVEQIRETILKLKIENEKLKNTDVNSHKSEIINHKSEIKVSSIQAISRRIDSLDFCPDLIIIDEAHHALAKTYRMLWERWPEAKFLGLTATPCRMDQTGFTDLFDTLVSSWSIAEFIRKGVLSTFDYVSIRPDSMEQRLIDSLKKRGADGDYQVKEMDEVLNRPPSIERLYRSLREHADGKKGIVYAISIDHARHIAQLYSERGIGVATIDSRTPEVERKRLVEAFKEGEIQVLVNVDIFSEGFDCPDVEFIQMARPTLSLSKYLQQVGRGLRQSKGKKGCMLIDNVGLIRTFGLPDQERDWEGMFQGNLEAWQDKETGLWGLKRGRRKTTEADFVTVFDMKEGRAAVRFRDNSCGLVDAEGEVMWRGRMCLSLKFVKNNFLMVTEKQGGKERYVDLQNLKEYDWKPEVRRYGEFELLKVRHTCYSRTREVYASDIDFGGILVADKGFYLFIFENGERYFCLLKGDEERYYSMRRRLADGSIVVADRTGGLYHVTEDGKKVVLEGEDGRKMIDRLDEEIRDRLEAEKEDRKRKIRKEYQEAVPYKAGLKWGLKVGNKVTIPPIYRKVQPPVGEYCAVEMNYGQWGVVGIDGTVWVEPRFPEVAVEEHGKVVLTDVMGRKRNIQLR